jgi:hypothetical protein
MKKKYLIILASAFGILALSFSAYLIKKAYIDKGFEKQKERETYLMLYIIANGEIYNQQTINKYKNLSTEQIKQKLDQLENQNDAPNDDFFNQ